jgi:hypothetical protein
VGLALWVFGNFLLWYLTVLTARHINQEGLVFAAMLVPVYWIMMSIAATKAAWQLIVTPSFWEKTTHGLTQDGDVVPIDARRTPQVPPTLSRAEIPIPRDA